jgi:hypothetical protein
MFRKDIENPSVPDTSPITGNCNGVKPDAVYRYAIYNHLSLITSIDYEIRMGLQQPFS